MTKIKCRMCNKNFKANDIIVVTDRNLEEPVHEECHYDYLLNMHLNNSCSLKEFKEMQKED
ncbi:hypothetical protein [Heyndrickxia ginsengihumi]|uniref:hypothetical protein n=1 Tax=Heyndrickxia ginsengihumi TaxID=363870 RepID=UPI0004723B12|nr:hypothetical protein [Heyndrickxia ginsengihumi]